MELQKALEAKKKKEKVTISLRIPADMSEWIKRVAKAHKTSITDVVEVAIERLQKDEHTKENDNDSQ